MRLHVSATWRVVGLFYFLMLLSASVGWADEASGDREITPEDVIVVANRQFAGSEEIARYYMQKRGILPEHLLLLDVTSEEDVDRECFTVKISGPILDFIHAKEGEGERVRCIVTVYGVPLSIWDPRPVQNEISILKHQIAGITNGTFQGDAVVLGQEVEQLEAKVKELSSRAAAVDSELAVCGIEHKLDGWVASPFSGEQGWPQGCYAVSRLDASTQEDVRRMIDGAVEAEEKGLAGIAYFDARGLTGNDAYSRMDEQIRSASRLLRLEGFATVVDNSEELFGEGKCPGAAVYWGWYSLSKYVDSFEFAPGAIAVHVASGECNSLREGPYWCRNLIAKGAAVTMGPTQEPYLEAFPAPDEFMERLFSGESVAEAYYATQKTLSWRMVLLGDPLYRPFAAGRKDRDAEKR